MVAGSLGDSARRPLGALLQFSVFCDGYKSRGAAFAWEQARILHQVSFRACDSMYSCSGFAFRIRGALFSCSSLLASFSFFCEACIWRIRFPCPSCLLVEISGFSVDLSSCDPAKESLFSVSEVIRTELPCL